MRNISRLFIALLVILSIFTQSFAFADDAIIEETVVAEITETEEAAEYAADDIAEEVIEAEEAAEYAADDIAEEVIEAEEAAEYVADDIAEEVIEEEITEYAVDTIAEEFTVAEEAESGKETVVCSSIFTSKEDFSAVMGNSKITDSHRYYRMPGYILLDFKLPQTTEKISKIYLDAICKASGTATMYLMPEELGLTRDATGKITDNSTTVISKLSETLKNYDMINIGTFECEAGSWDASRAELSKTGLTAFRELFTQGKTNAVICLAAPLSDKLDLVHLDIRNGGSVNVRPELTFEYFTRPVATVNGLIGIPFENTDLKIDYTFDSTEYVEGDTTFQWYKKTSEDAEWQAVETETTDTLTLTSEWNDCYVKASVIPVAQDDTDGYNDRSIGEEVFTTVYGPVWSESAANVFVADLGDETDPEKFMEKVEEANVVLELDTELTDLGAEGKTNVVNTVMNSEYTTVKEFQAVYNAAIVIEKIAIASQDDADNTITTELLLSEELKNEEFGLFINRFENLTDKNSVVDAIQAGSYENVEAFITAFNNNMAVYELNNAGRDNAEEILNAYDSMLTANISSITGDDLEAVIVDFLKEDAKTEFSQWDSAIDDICSTPAVSEEVVVKVPSTVIGGGGGGGGGGGISTFVKKDEEEAATTEPQPEVNSEASTEINLNLFNDVADDHWAKASITSLAEKGIVNGYDGMFEPERSVTREEFVKMLVQAFGFKGSVAISFNDVNEDDWYYEYIATAVNNKIVSGISNEEFGVGMEITREDMAVMIYRALQHLGHTFNENSVIVFDDYYEISEYARTAVGVMSYNKLVNGVGDNLFDSKSTATRAMAAAIIDRAISFRK